MARYLNTSLLMGYRFLVLRSLLCQENQSVYSVEDNEMLHYLPNKHHFIRKRVQLLLYGCFVPSKRTAVRLIRLFNVTNITYCNVKLLFPCPIRSTRCKIQRIQVKITTCAGCATYLCTFSVCLLGNAWKGLAFSIIQHDQTLKTVFWILPLLCRLRMSTSMNIFLQCNYK